MRRSTRVLTLLGAFLLVVGTASGVYGLVSSTEVPEPPAEPSDIEELATPVLSARRIPEWTTELVPAHRVAADLKPIVERAPADTCVQVGWDGADLYAHQGSTQLTPASNMKLLTSAAALDLLGANTTLPTTFLAAAAPLDGTLEGNLYMVGGGDPLLTTDGYQLNRIKYRQPETDLEPFADAIVAAGVRNITGSVVGDGSLYGDQLWVDSWPQRHRSNGTVGSLSSLLVNDGWLVDPVTGAGPGGPAPDPSAHAASVMTQLLSERGVTIAGPPTSGSAGAADVEIAAFQSAPVSELIADVLKFSDNTTAELLVKQIGLTTSGQPTTEAGLGAIREWAAEKGHPVEGAELVDGSGLSYDNRISCALLASLLRSDGPQGPVSTALAVPGEAGTLIDRFSGGEWKERLRAKTGTLNTVASLSGWLHSRPEADLDFAILMNTGDRGTTVGDLGLQQEILTALLEHPQVPSLADAGPLGTAS